MAAPIPLTRLGHSCSGDYSCGLELCLRFSLPAGITGVENGCGDDSFICASHADFSWTPLLTGVLGCTSTSAPQGGADTRSLEFQQRANT